MNLSPFYARATAEIPEADKLITEIIKAHFTAKREGLLCLEFCADRYPAELAFFFSRIELPFSTLDEIALIKFAQIARYPASLTRYLVAYRACKAIMLGEDVFSLLAVLKVILGKDDFDLDLEPTGEEIDAMLWKADEVLHFSDLLKLDDKTLQLMMREMEWRETALAFSRSSAELRNRVLTQCSASARSDLRLRMYIGGSEEKCRFSQEKWLEVLGKLVDAGEIEI